MMRQTLGGVEPTAGRHPGRREMAGVGRMSKMKGALRCFSKTEGAGAPGDRLSRTRRKGQRSAASIGFVASVQRVPAKARELVSHQIVM